MRSMICIMMIFVTPIACSASSIEEHILVHYNLVVDQLSKLGFKGPFACETAKFRARQADH